MGAVLGVTRREVIVLRKETVVIKRGWANGVSIEGATRASTAEAV